MISEKIHAAKHYFRYLSKAKGPHGVHSPFIFGLVNEVLLSDDRFYAFDQIEAERSRLLLSKKSIERTDLGAGSQMTGNKVEIGQFAKVGLCPPSICQLLFKLSKYIDAKNALEIGTALGITTAYLASSDLESVHTLEGDPELLKEAQVGWENLGLSNIESIQGDFKQTLPELMSTGQQFDLVFVDGNHKKEPTLEYVELIKASLRDNAVVIIDDIYWSKAMTDAWNILVEDKYFSLTADLYRFGLLFKKPGVVKQHFVLKRS